MRPAENADPPRPSVLIAASLVALGMFALAPGAPAAQPLSISASASPAELTLGTAVTVSGRLAGVMPPPATEALQLEAAPYPFHSFTVIARGQSAADGSFSLPAGEPQENTRMRVSLAGSPATVSAPVQVTVDPLVSLHERSLGPGRVQLSIRIVHTRTGGRPAASVFWYLAPRGSQVFELAATSASRELAPGVTYASAVLDPPARRFSYRVCINPGWEAAMGPAATHGACPARSFRLTGGR